MSNIQTGAERMPHDLSHLGFQIFISGFYSAQTTLLLDDWQKQQQTPADRTWLMAEKASVKSKYWYPTEDAFIEEKIGKVYQWKTYNQIENTPELNEQRQTILKAYRNQTHLTPNWPKAWFNLLSIKIELQQFDDEFYQAYAKAKQTTDQTPGMQTAFTLVGIQSWHGVNNKTKSDILKNIVREASSSKKNSQNIKTLLEAYNLQQISCAYANAIKANTYELCK